jgi:hypothetical protein
VQLYKLEDTMAVDPDECTITNTMIKEAKDANNANSNDNGCEKGGLELSREKIFADSTLYPFPDVYDKNCIRDTHTLI